jgi:hypothetical protein
MSLPGGIDSYFQLIHTILASSPVIKSQDVFAEKRTLTEGYLRANIVFSDGSLLHFRELVTTEPDIQRISYTYHYQRADETIVFRYDDSPHFPLLPNAPHHKHIGESEVVSSEAPDLPSVLSEIERLIG